MARLPKGPSNSANMGATPGTQQTAQRNVAVGGLNPNMPRGPQVQRQAASPYQQSLRGQSPVARPGGQALPQRPAQPSRQSTRQPSRGPVGDREVSGRTVTRGSAMDAGRGYNIFQGMSAPEIVSSNREMGMSNMTALPSLVPEASNRQLNPNRDMQLRQPMGSNANKALAQFASENPSTAQAVGNLEGFMASGEQQRDQPEEIEPYTMGGGTQNKVKQVVGISNREDLISNEVVGIDPEKKAAAEEKVSFTLAQQLQSTLSGIDRAMAMNGTFGSGAHSFALNNATAEAMKIWADKSVALDIMDIEQAELDEQQMVENLGALTDDYAALEDQWLQLENTKLVGRDLELKKMEIQAAMEANVIAQASLYSEEMGAQVQDAYSMISDFSEGKVELEFKQQISDLWLTVQKFIKSGGSYEEAQNQLSNGLMAINEDFQGMI